MKKIAFLSGYLLFIPLLFFSSCDPNKELYEELDNIKQPYSKSIEYVLLEADYNSVGGLVANIKAFTDDYPAMDYVPAMLARKFIALNLGSSAMVSFNYLVAEPIWLKAGFGYVLTPEDYTSLGLSDAFTPAIQAKDNLPSFLLRKFRNETIGTQKNILYNFREGSNLSIMLDVYEFNGFDWIWLETREDIPFIGYELSAEDYKAFGGNLAINMYFSDSYPAAVYLPVFLKNAFSYAIADDEQVLKYKVLSGGVPVDEISHFVFDGQSWKKSSNIVPKSEQYVYGNMGWAFDPTTRFIMTQSDYMFLATNDPIPHAVYADFGYYYGAAAYYSNFDMRLAARRTAKNPDGAYFDAALGAIFDSQGAEATVEEMFRRIVEEALILLLQHKYPQATPQSGGIDVHYIVGFETYNDNFSRSYLEAEYRCTASGSPPQFELVEGPRQRQ